MKFDMDVVPLETPLDSYFFNSLHSVIPSKRMFKFVRWHDDANTRYPLGHVALDDIVRCSVLISGK
jgi:hypothetical protein